MKPKEPFHRELLDRIPAQELEAEKGVIGSILLKPDVLDDIGTQLRADHFYADANQRIYRAMLALHDANGAVDTLTLMSHLKQNGDLEAVGGAAYLAEVSQSVPYAANAGHYARLIVRAANLRSLRLVGESLITDTLDTQGEPSDILNMAEAQLAAIDSGKEQYTVTAHEAVTAANERIDAIQARGESAGVMTGLISYDRKHGGLFGGELVVLAARPGMGKTAMAMQIAYHSAKKGRRVYFASLEMSAVELTIRLMCSQSGVNNRRIRTGKVDDRDRTDLAEVSGIIAGTELIIADAPEVTAHDIRRGARHARKDGLDLVVLDYLQLLKPDDPKRATHETLDEQTKTLRLIARELDVPVLCLCQLNREADKGSPRMSHLKGSGGIEQNADVIILLDRPNANADKSESSEATLIVDKNRAGATGAEKLEFLACETRFICKGEAEASGDFVGLDDPDRDF